MKNKFIDRVNNIYWKYNTGAQSIKSSHDMAVLTSICAFGKNSNRGPIGVTRALFNDKECTVILLGGTQIKEGQATRLKESKLASLGRDNDYLRALMNVFTLKKDNRLLIPKDREILIFGISLGGMIAQQIIGIDKIVNNYKINSIICFGSPVTPPFDRRGIRVRRFADKGDIVPKLGKIYYKKKEYKDIFKKLDSEELILEDGNYKKRIESHALSYIESKCFLKYDFYGELNGNNKLEILDEIKFYDAPVIDE